MLLWLLGCVHPGPALRLDRAASVALVSPTATGNPYTVDLLATGVGIDGVSVWADGASLGTVPVGRALHWRSPKAGPVELTLYGMRGDVAVARERRTIEVGVGLSDAVQAIVATFPTDGSMGYYWPPDDGVWWGTPRDLSYLGTLVSPADPEGRSHCVGLTWDVAVTALEAEAGGPDRPVNGWSLDQLADFRTDWFVRELLGPGAAEAVEHYGVGERVPMRELQPGDFLQIWHSAHSGHSAIFEGWVYRGRRIVGIRYWSTHPATDGIGVREERFGVGGVSRAYLYGARLWQAEDWEPPKEPPAPR
jgi:hypothetical protein